MNDQLRKWLANVEEILMRRYRVDIVDLGWDDAAKVRYFAFGWEPVEFTRWYGMKYDLVEYTSAYVLREGC